MLPGDSVGEPCPLSSDPGTPLSLARAVDLALCHNAQIRDSWAMIRQQAAALGIARAAYWPTLSVNASELNDRDGYPDSKEPATVRTGDSVYAALA